MNLKVRIKNPVFWVQMLGIIFGTALTYAGITADNLTTWPSLWQVITGVVSNPYCLGLICWNLWSALNDPTTSGLSDSARAMTYDKPSKGDEKE